MNQRSYGNLLREAIDRLTSAGVLDAEISARTLLGSLLQKSQSDLQLAIKDIADSSIAEKFRILIEQRAERIPLQYLLGYLEFYDLKLTIDRRAFIPRPETEILVDEAIKIIADRKIKVLDIGTGSGCIAIAIARNAPNVKFTAIDISADALELAHENAILNNVENKIDFIKADCLDIRFWATIGDFDIVISNPPYVTETEYENTEPEIKLFEPRQALVVPDNDPLIYYRSIADGCASMANPPMAILVEISFGRAADVGNLFNSFLPDYTIETIKDMSGIERVIIGRAIR